jgi:hypothetical protein
MSARRVSVWWNKQIKAWVTEINRKRYTFAKGRKTLSRRWTNLCVSASFS